MANSVFVPVLCTPRCGSSLVAGVLHHLGVFMGTQFAKPDKNVNPTGFFEDMEFTTVFAGAGGHNWKHWLEVARRDYKLDNRRNLRLEQTLKNRLAKHELWGFKDARAMYFFDQIMAVVQANGGRVKAVRAVRDLAANAESMRVYPSQLQGHHSRPSLEIEDALEAARGWAALRDETAAKLPASDVLTVDYDALVDDPQGQVARLADWLGLPVRADAVALVDPKLRHHQQREAA